MRDLFINACILFTLTFFGFLPFRHRKIEEINTRFLLGVITGLSGLLLMYFTLPLPHGIALDLRLIPLIVAATYGGLAASLPSGIIISVGRIVLFGASTASMAAAINMLIIGVVAPLLARIIGKRPYTMLIINIYTLLQVTYLLRDINIWLICLYWLWTIGMGLLVQWVIEALMSHYTFQTQLRQMAEHDFLTGLMNTRQFDYLLHKAIKDFHEHEQVLSLLLIDIDHFKDVNDTYGHPSGDAVLRQLAILLQHQCRPGDAVARTGGEEFAIILPNCSKESAPEIAERIRLAVQNHIFQLDNASSTKITISVGVAVHQYRQPMSPSDLIATADKALYCAKNKGRNQVCTA